MKGFVCTCEKDNEHKHYKMFMIHCETVLKTPKADYQSIKREIKKKCKKDPENDDDGPLYFCPLAECKNKPLMTSDIMDTHLDDHSNSELKGNEKILQEFVDHLKKS